MASQFEATRRLPLRFFIEAGVLENVSENGPSLLSANQHFVQILKKKGYAVTYEEVGGTHEPVHWRVTFSDALVALVNESFNPGTQ